MMIYKLMALAFLFLTPIFSFILVKFFRLRRFKINFADFSLPLYAFELVLVSQEFYTHNFFPYYLIVMSLLAIVLTIVLLWGVHAFSYRRFFKLFWRIGFIVTFFCYLLTVIIIFLTQINFLNPLNKKNQIAFIWFFLFNHDHFYGYITSSKFLGCLNWFEEPSLAWYLLQVR